MAKDKLLYFTVKKINIMKYHHEKILCIVKDALSHTEAFVLQQSQSYIGM